MSSAREMVKILKGTLDQKKQLFDELLIKAVDVGLEDFEIPILEALKKELIVESKVVQMEANLEGSANFGRI
jgi:hypothetical protein